jgi:hypothetical protein
MNSVKRENIDNFGFQQTHFLLTNFISLAIRTYLLGIFGEHPPSRQNVILHATVVPVPVIDAVV